MLLKIFGNVILLLSVFHLLKKYLQKYIKNEIVCFQVYRSVICTFIALYSSIQIYLYWDKFWLTPTEYYNEHIERINILSLSYFISDLITMITLNNNRISLWIHHIFCLMTLSLHCIYYNNPCIILNWVSIAEFMSTVSGIDAVAKYFRYDKILWWTKLYRCFIIVLVRFPIWCILSNFVFTRNMYFAAQVNCIIGAIIMNLLDVYWFALCSQYLNLGLNFL